MEEEKKISLDEFKEVLRIFKNMLIDGDIKIKFAPFSTETEGNNARTRSYPHQKLIEKHLKKAQKSSSAF